MSELRIFERFSVSQFKLDQLRSNVPTNDPQAVAELQGHRAILQEAGIDDLSSLGVLRLEGYQATRKGILTPATAAKPSGQARVSKAYRLINEGANAEFVGGVQAELKQTIQLPSRLDDIYWAASEIIVEPNTVVVLSAGEKFLTIICEKLTVGENVTFTWDREPKNPRPAIRSDDAQAERKHDPERAPTAFPGTDGGHGKWGEKGGDGWDGADAPKMIFWLMELAGRPMFDLNGEDGQKGGRGERGENGQHGGHGNDSRAFGLDCQAGPGAGGRGGDGGRGGPGGAGGNGGHGGKLVLNAPKEVILQYASSFYVTANGGRAGNGGQGGLPGTSGAGGKLGNVWWPCTKMGRTDGAGGSSEIPEGSSGAPGKDGDKFSDAFSFLPITRDDFNRELTRPAIKKIEPSEASVGSEVSVNGLRFTPTDVVVVADVAAPIRFVNDQKVIFRVPAVGGGPQEVRVRQTDGTPSHPGTLTVKPSLDRIEPAGRIKPGSIVTLIGGGFKAGCRVWVNGVDAPDVQFINSGQLKCRIVRPANLPANPAGEPVKIKVILPDGTAAADEKEVILDTYRILAMGDSIIWGQGLRDEEKIYSLVANHVATRPEYSGQNRIGIYKTLVAHSGAIIGFKDNGDRDNTKFLPIHGEVPTSYPTILEQCESFMDAPDTIDLIILDGGINDVEVSRILNVLKSDAELRQLTKTHCHIHMARLLRQVVAKFPNAKVVVTGYFPIVSDQSDTNFLAAFLGGLGLAAETLVALGLGAAIGVGPGAVAGVTISKVVRDRLVERCKIFAEQSATSLQDAVDEVNATLPAPRIALGHPQYRQSHSALTQASWLYGINADLTPQDEHIRNERLANCEECKRKEPNRDINALSCQRASLGHPNPTGAREYAKAIIRDVFPFSSEFLGYADLHCHPMAHLGFGGNLFAGEPDGAMDEALRWCSEKHGAGGTGLFGEVGSLFMAAFEGKGPGHHVGGYPEFDGWPRYTSLIHQHMYVDWIRRAYEGGLRLICAAAVNNPLLAKEFGGSYTDDVTAINLQIEAIKQFITRHSTWMEVALTPDDAKRIITGNKLAVVLAVEVEALGNWVRESDCSNEQVSMELRRLFGMGVRMITPIHLINNAFGGTEIKGEVFNILNRFMRGEGDYFEVESGLAEGIEFRLGEEGEEDLVKWFKGVGNVISGKGFYQPPAYDQTMPGHINKRGLTDRGKFLVEEMMRLGMLIDVDHMSTKSINDTLTIAERYRYPVVSTHTSFRDLTWRRGDEHKPETRETTDIQKLPCEKNKSRKTLERIRALGGMV
ncbi:MAG TPA: membrane dipeptidase, partial [Blastocatellia bacterium]|nr:membrane dipeptidase [Blastocatellia bacterium]